MRKLYLIRHGEPAFPNGQLYLPLSTLGRLQSCLVGWELRSRNITQVFSSRLSRELCLTLLDAAGASEQVKAHCQAVAAEALRIGSALPLQLDQQLIECAALLHDIARTQPKHPQTGAAWLRALGYSEIANVVELHHDHDGEHLDEAAVLFIADKCIKETELVSLETRFTTSAQRCRDEAALAAHQRRYQAAMAIKRKINDLCQKEVVT